MEIKKLGNIYSELWLQGLSALPASLNKLSFKRRGEDFWCWRSGTKAYFSTEECIADCETELAPYLDTLIQLQQERHFTASLKAFAKPLGYERPILDINPANASFASLLGADIELQLLQYPLEQTGDEFEGYEEGEPRHYIECQDKTKTPIVQASFGLAGIDFDVDMDFEHISEALNVPYTKIRSKHDFPQSSKDFGFAADSWSIKTPKLYNAYNLSAEFDKLIKPLLGKEDIIETLKKENRLVARFGGLFHTYEEYGIPKLLFSKEFVRFAAKTSAHLSIDYYCY